MQRQYGRVEENSAKQCFIQCVNCRCRFNVTFELRAAPKRNEKVRE